MQPYVTDAMRAAVQETMKTRFIGQGPVVDELERKFEFELSFAGHITGQKCVATGSCTDALHLAYTLAGVESGSEIIAPLFTCTATNIPFLYWGRKKKHWYSSETEPAVKIRFCDVAPNSLNMDPNHVLRLINEKTRAIVVVHYGGAPVDRRIFDIAAEWGIPVIEDCAQAVGVPWAGTRGLYACFSFQAVKHLTAGDGGMLVLPKAQLAEARRRRWFGIDREAKLAGRWENDIREVGWKYQLTDIGASMVLAGLRSLDAQIAHRRALRDSYINWLEGIPGISVIDRDPESACWLMTVAVDRRKDFQKKLLAAGIENDRVHYRNDRYTIFKEFRGSFPNMDAMDPKYLVLPLHMGMTVKDVERICKVIRSGW
jgi:perosamine synthetase